MASTEPSEGAALSASRPLCECHGEPMWMSGNWRCRYRQGAANARWRAANLERAAANGRAWDKANPDKRKAITRLHARKRYGWFDEGGMATKPTQFRELTPNG